MVLFRRPAPRPAPTHPTPVPAGQELPERPPAPSRVHDGKFLAVFGDKGTGKTTYLRHVWWARRRKGGSGVMLDPKAENGDMGQVVSSPERLEELVRIRAREGRPFSAVIQPGWGGDLEPYYPVVFSAGHLLLAMDEAQTAADLNTSTRGGAIRIIGMGRSRSIDIITTVRTPPEVHKQFRANLDVLITFHQTNPDYARLLAEDYFFQPSLASKILSLPKFHFVRFDGSRVTQGNISI